MKLNHYWKNISLIATAILVALAMNSSAVMAGEDQTAPAVKAEESKPQPGWTSYSNGLYYKNLALQDPSQLKAA